MKKQLVAATGLPSLTSLALAVTKVRWLHAPAYGIVVSKSSDKTASELTECVLHYISLLGGNSFIINVQGQYREDLYKWTMSGSSIGTVDIIGCLKEKFMSLGVKIGKVKNSETQKEIEHYVIVFGRYYTSCSSYQKFYKWISTRKEIIQ